MIPVTISWAPVICDCEDCYCQTLVKYRITGNNNPWITPDNPTNPTPTTEYVLYINPNTQYEVWLTFQGPLCAAAPLYLGIYYPSGQCCPAGYTLAPEGNYCYKIEEIAATPPSGAVSNLVARNNISYCTCGSYIYDIGWNVNGTGPSNPIPFSNPFWVNGEGDCNDIGSPNLTDGPLNRNGVWVNPPQDGQDIGFGICLDVPVTKVYYIGVGADNNAIMKIDGATHLSQNATALGVQYGVTIDATFRVWHIYPVQLTAGPHVIEIYGHNITGPAAIGCEVYNATAAEIAAATSYIDLGSKLLFSSKDEIGQPAQLGTGDVAYTCPAGYSIAGCGVGVTCRRILNSSLINC